MVEVSRLPGPYIDEWEWQYQGACRYVDSTLFFHPEGERGPTRLQRDESAKAICRTCPVISQCRQHALQAREPYGVWGGLTADERADIVGGRTDIASPVPQAPTGKHLLDLTLIPHAS